MRYFPGRVARSVVIVVAVVLSGCSAIVAQQTSGLADALGSAIRANKDLQTVKDGAPAYLLLMDAMVQQDPESPALLLGAADLYSFYGGVFVDDPARAVLFANKAMGYATEGSCLQDALFCDWASLDREAYEARLAELEPDHLATLNTVASVWVGWIQANSDDWNAIAQLSRVQQMIERMVALDPNYEQGTAQLYLGVLHTLLPPLQGGKPELGRSHFEAAIAASEGRNLLAKTYFAKFYARMVFEQELHHQLLTEVIDADFDDPQFNLMNELAKQEARMLLADEADYF
ncbi:MAG: TRAP transporter TatT component family protein [Halieaceae bacterium]